MLDADKFGTLTGGRRIWAVAAVLGERDRLAALHGALIGRIELRDRLVYLGNYLGYGPDIVGTVDELIAFRSAVMALPGMMPQDIVFLRGAQEEMWHKLLQLQLALSPGEVLTWMLARGVEATIVAYGGRPADGMAAARGGTLTLTRWTGALRDAMVGPATAS